MSPNFGLSPTPATWNTLATTGVTPKPTLSPLYPQHNGLLRRDNNVGKNTCGWINGDQNQPFTCGLSSTCVADAQFTAFACCASTDCNYDFATVCVDSDPGICVENSANDCFHYDWTIGCVGGGGYGCITYAMPGGVPFSSLGCDYTPGIVTVQTTYAGGPANQQVPMPYSEYLVAASSAAGAASSAAQASSSSSSGDSGDDTAETDWIAHHKTILIGAIVGVAVLLLLCCCSVAFCRGKRRTRSRPAPAPPGAPIPQYNYDPQRGMQGQGQGQGQEYYPMMQHQYGPNK